MKNKQYIVLCILMIAFVVITSYTPKTAQAEVKMQGQGDSEGFHNQWQDQRIDISNVPSDIDAPDYFEKEPSKLEGDNQIYGQQWGYYSALGSTSTPYHSEITYYSDYNGCLGSNYDWNLKFFYIPVNVPDGAKAASLHLTYHNNTEDPGGKIYVALKRKLYNSTQEETVKDYILEKVEEGEHYTQVSLIGHTFDTNYYLYWFEFTLPFNPSERQFCGVQISYFTTPPPLFPLAFPGVMTGP